MADVDGTDTMGGGRLDEPTLTGCVGITIGGGGARIVPGVLAAAGEVCASGEAVTGDYKKMTLFIAYRLI